MKRIAVFFYVDQRHGGIKLGGAERRLSRIFDELTFYGFETNVVLKVDRISEKVDLMYKSVLKHNHVKINQFESYLEMIRYMKKEKFDWICYTDSYRAMVPFVLGGLLSKSKRMMLNVTTYASQLKFSNKNQKHLFQLIVKLSNHMDVLYPSGFKCLKENYPSKSITLTPGAFTDLNTFYPKDKKKRIVFLSSLVENKNPELFLDAIYLIKDFLLENKYDVMICGTGNLEKTLESKIKKYNCENLVKMLGNVLPQDILPETEIFVSIQNYNNYPSQALLEAISSGCYIIASNEGDTKLIVNETFGDLCQLDDENIANKIRNYIEKTKREKNNVISSARNFGVKEFAIEKSVLHYYNLFS